MITAITAKEARELVQLSTQAMSTRLDAICKKIREVAARGDSAMLIDVELPYSTEFTFPPSVYVEPDLTPIQLAVKKELEQLGFKVALHGVYHENKGGWYPAPEDNREPYTSWHLRVSW